MSLRVKNVSNETNSASQRKKGKEVGQQHSAIPMVGSRRMPTKIDESNDGKFSFSQAAKNFGKGLISPVTSMFASKKSFAMGALMIVGSAALVIATGGAATPLLIAAGVGMGAFQGGKAAYKIATAKNGDDIEKACFDIGGATSTIGLSMLGAKGSLKQASVSTEGLNSFSATAKCFTSAKSLAVEGFTTFKNGYFKTNMANALKPLMNPRVFKKYSKAFAKEGKENFDAAFKETRDILPEEMKPLLIGRPKGEKSIYSKLLDECIMKDKIEKTLKRTDLTEAQKKAAVIVLKNKGVKFKTDANAAKGMVNDLIGTRLVLDDAGKAPIAKLVTSIVDAINNDKIVISEIRNYRGPDGHFYFSKDQIAAIKDAAIEKNIKITVLEGKKQIKSSGYNAVQLKINHKNGSYGELQIRGKMVDKVAEFEHVPYDLKTGKDISRGSNKIGGLLTPFRKAVKKLSDEQYADYEKYLAKTYRYARRQELGLNSKKVKLPKSFDKLLSTENLHTLHEKTSSLPTKEVAPLLPVPQTAVSYNFLKLVNKEAEK